MQLAEGRTQLLDQILDLEQLQSKTLSSYKEFAKPIKLNKNSFDLADLLRSHYYGEKQLKELKEQYKDEPDALSALNKFEQLNTKHHELKQKLQRMN